jgi:hypothetical protein
VRQLQRRLLLWPLRMQHLRQRRGTRQGGRRRAVSSAACRWCLCRRPRRPPVAGQRGVWLLAVCADERSAHAPPRASTDAHLQLRCLVQAQVDDAAVRAGLAQHHYARPGVVAKHGGRDLLFGAAAHTPAFQSRVQHATSGMQARARWAVRAHTPRATPRPRGAHHSSKRTSFECLVATRMLQPTTQSWELASPSPMTVGVGGWLAAGCVRAGGLALLGWVAVIYARRRCSEFTPRCCRPPIRDRRDAGGS